MRSLILRLTALVACLFAAQADAATVPVTVTVNSVRNISSGVLGSTPNFHATLWIDRAQRNTPTVFSSQGFVSPAGWSLTRQVSRAARGGIASIRVELRSLDVVFGDSLVDIDPGTCSTDGLPFGCADIGSTTPPVDTFGIDVTLNLFDGSWSPVDARGDSSMPTTVPVGVGQMACTSGAGNNAANICFTITVGSPRPELLTVSKTADSNRGFCAPGNCSLREAVTVAEDADVIDLPASTTPYLLAGEGDGHLAIRPAPGDLPRQVHIRGPRLGGTAVIRQTWEPFRVFDVHAKAKLLLTRATITGGGADRTSTAQPVHVHGGGIHNHGEIDLRHVTITGNRATYSQVEAVGGGGGIYNASGAIARLTNVTIAGNVSWPNGNGVPLGGGIAGPGAYLLRNTLLANNAVVWPNGAAGPPSNCGAATPLNITDEGGNLQYPGSDCGRWFTKTNRFGATFTFWWPYFATASMDPLLPFDAQNGIFVPLAMGPAIDAGVTGCGPTDQTGRTAPADGNGDGQAVCDVGAIEAP